MTALEAQVGVFPETGFPFWSLIVTASWALSPMTMVGVAGDTSTVVTTGAGGGGGGAGLGGVAPPQAATAIPIAALQPQALVGLDSRMSGLPIPEATAPTHHSIRSSL